MPANKMGATCELQKASKRKLTAININRMYLVTYLERKKIRALNTMPNSKINLTIPESIAPKPHP